MLLRKGHGDILNIFFAFLPVPAEIFLIQEIHQHQLGHGSRHGAELEGGLGGAAAQHHIRLLGGRGLGEPGHQNGGDLPLLGQLQQFFLKFRSSFK